MYTKVRDLLAMGKEYNACILAFDCADVNMIRSVCMGAEKAKKPVIIMLHPSPIYKSILPFGVFAQTTKYFADRVSVPVGLHLDHCGDFDEILTAIHEGFDSVMADGSLLPLDENIAFTKKVVEVARNFGVDVEGELGHVGVAMESDDFSKKEFFTKPDEVTRFTEETGVTSLAVSFGSAHGLYKFPPKLDIDHLIELRNATGTPLVLHGGTGIGDDQLKAAFANGINKINIGTEFYMLNTRLNKEFYADDTQAPYTFPAYIQPVLADYIAKRLELCTIEL
ncbi:MAG: class II fructose-bisphosphate aldolase [Oscillospiraceae bacterium]|nr:class II fructose-bisphosphate aldolase [Oscillospiraceae bacterium]